MTTLCVIGGNFLVFYSYRTRREAEAAMDSTRAHGLTAYIMEVNHVD